MENIALNYQAIFKAYSDRAILHQQLRELDKQIDGMLLEAYHSLPEDHDPEDWVEFAPGQIAKFDLFEDQEIPHIHFEKFKSHPLNKLQK